MRKCLVALFLLIPAIASAQISGTTCPGNGCIDLNVGGQGTIGIQISGTWAGTISFLGSIDNTNYAAVQVYPLNSSTSVTTTTGNGIWTAPIAGLSSVRVVFTIYTSGSAVVNRRTTSTKSRVGSGGGGGVFTALPTSMYYPEIIAGVSNTVTLGQLRIQTGQTKQAAIITIPKTGTLDKIEFRTDTITTAQDVKISFQAVDPASGNPIGVVDQFVVVTGASLAVGWQVPGLITSDGTGSGSKRTVSAGDLLAIVFEFNATLGDVRFTSILKNSSTNLMADGYQYVDSFDGVSTWTKSANGFVGALKYSDGSYAYVNPNMIPFSNNTTTATAFNSGSSPNERGLIFQFPFSVTVSGVWFLSTRAGDCQVKLYDTDGTTVLSTISLDKDNTMADTPVTIAYFSTPINLTTNGTYRISVVPTTVTNITTYDIPFSTNALMQAALGGVNFFATTRTGGAWTNNNLAKPLMGLVISAIKASTP